MNSTSVSLVIARGMKPDMALRRIRAFEKRFGADHLHFARHAAFPLALTPQLLYDLWYNFRSPMRKEDDWIKVADLLLSPLCNEVGYELYEMDLTVRMELLRGLKNLSEGGRLQELANFMLEYIRQRLHTTNPVVGSFAESQRWIALTYTQPSQAAAALALALSKYIHEENRAEQIRIATLIEISAEPLQDFSPLIIAARGYAFQARDELERAHAEFMKLRPGDVSTVQRLGLPIPSEMIQEIEDAYQSTTTNVIHDFAFTKKLLVITAGTTAGHVGQKLVQQVESHHNELQVMICSLDTASQRASTHRNNEQHYHMAIDQKKMHTIHRMRKSKSFPVNILYDSLPPTINNSAGGVRYNGASALVYNQDQIKIWLKNSLSSLSPKNDVAPLSIAIVISAAGATGSGSLLHLLKVVEEATTLVNTSSVTCNIYIMMPDPAENNTLKLANIFALFAELAARQLSQIKQGNVAFQGRIILVGWGRTKLLSSVEQLEETTANLIRLTNDLVSGVAIDYEEWRGVNQYLWWSTNQETGLPTHLSSATPVTIGLGNLEEQIIERDTNRLIAHLIFGNEVNAPLRSKGNPFQAILDRYKIRGKDAIERHESLIDYLTRDITFTIKEKGHHEIETEAQEQSAPKSWLEDLRKNDKRAILMQVPDIERAGTHLFEDLIKSWREQELTEFTMAGDFSLTRLKHYYEGLRQLIDEMLSIALEGIPLRVPEKVVERSIQDIPNRRNAQRRNELVKLAARRVNENVADYHDDQANKVAIHLLQDLTIEIDKALSRPRRALVNFDKKNSSIRDIATRPLSSHGNTPLQLAVLSDNKKRGAESEIEHYYRLVSPIAPLEHGNTTFITDANLEFRRWFAYDTNGLEYLFNGDMENLLNTTREYVAKKISSEIKKYSVLDLMLHDDGEPLYQCLQEAKSLANSLINYSQSLAYESKKYIYICAYWGKNKNQYDKLYKLITEVFNSGEWTLLESNDPTEIVVVYCVDGLSMAALSDLNYHYFDAFLRHQQRWTKSPTSIEVPVFSGKDAEALVQEYEIISRLNRVARRIL